MCGRFTQKLTWRELHDLCGLLADASPDNMRPRRDRDCGLKARLPQRVQFAAMPSPRRRVVRVSPVGWGESPRFLSMADGSIASFAALWERWDGGEEAVESFTIITTAASPGTAHAHNRQPPIVDPARFDEWLTPDALKEALLEMVQTPNPGPYEVKPISRLVNYVSNGGRGYQDQVD